MLTDILLGATREPVLLAKQVATLDHISRGRFVLGIGAGGREDDFAVTGFDFHTRGKRLDSALDLMHRAWRGEPVPGTTQPVTPRPLNGHSVPLIFGGYTPRAIARAAKYGIGYTLGGGTPERLKAMMETFTAAWKEAGRGGKPEFRALNYFALGDDVAAEAESNIKDYYGDYGAGAWKGATKSAAEAKERVKAFADAGCNELLFFMAAPSVAQAERIAKAVL